MQGWFSLTPTIRAMLAAAAASKCFLAMQRVERDDSARGEAGFGQQRLRRRDLVGLLGDVDVGEHRRGVGGERAQHLCCGTVTELVKTAAQRLAIQCDAALSWCGAPRLQQGGMAAAEGILHHSRIEPLEDVADSGVRRCSAPVQAEGRVQLVTVNVDDLDSAKTQVLSGLPTYLNATRPVLADARAPRVAGEKVGTGAHEGIGR